MRLGLEQPIGYEARQLDDASVLADRLQAEGDLRGELLALEIASARVSDSEEARALNREAQRLRAHLGARLWPKISNVRVRAGLVIECDHPDEAATMQLTPSLTRGLRRLVVIEPRRARAHHLQPDTLVCSQLGPDDLPTLRAMTSIASLTFRTLESQVTILDELASMGTLESLHVGSLEAENGRLAAATLSTLARMQLVELTLGHARVGTLEALASLPTLRALDCHVLANDPGLADALRSLRGLASLGLRGAGFEVRPIASAIADLQLQRLSFVDGVRREPDMLAKRRDAFAPVYASETLEELHVSLFDLDPRELAGMPRLRALTLRHVSEPNASLLPPLDHLGILGPVIRRMRTLPSSSLHLRNHYGYNTAQHELLGRLSRLRRRGSPPLRQLDVDHDRFIHDGDPRLRGAFGSLEHLTIGWASPGLGPALASLPRLRRLTVLNLGPEQHASLSARLPHVLVESTQLWPRAFGSFRPTSGSQPVLAAGA